MEVRKASVGDAAAMHRLINRFADQGEMLPRALSQIYENIRDYFVVREGPEIIGCCALHVSWVDLAEIRSLAVEGAKQNQGVGACLVGACLDEASKLGLSRVFCLTRQPGFFDKHGFRLIDRMELPHKIWAECYNCPKFPNCDEVALVRDLGQPDARPMPET